LGERKRSGYLPIFASTLSSTASVPSSSEARTRYMFRKCTHTWTLAASRFTHRSDSRKCGVSPSAHLSRALLSFSFCLSLSLAISRYLSLSLSVSVSHAHARTRSLSPLPGQEEDISKTCTDTQYIVIDAVDSNNSLYYVFSLDHSGCC